MSAYVQPTQGTTPTPQLTELLWRGAFTAMAREHGFEQLRVEGRLPEDVRGTLYRNGPGRFHSHGHRYRHWFDGDGAISAVRLEGGQAWGAARVVQSAGLVEEERQGKMLYGGYGSLPPNVVFKRLTGQDTGKNAANTSVLMWQDRLFALWEGGLPTELTPDTLETLGERDLSVIPQSFSAHPHAVPGRRALYNFGVRYGRESFVDIVELPLKGAPRLLASVPLAGMTMIHDFIATENHLIFVQPPLRLRGLRALLGFGSYVDNLVWRPDEGTEILIVPIDDPASVVRINVEPFFQWHFANAYERGGALVVDVVRYPDFGTDRWLAAMYRDGQPSHIAQGLLWRMTLDPLAKSCHWRQLAEPLCEFPRVAPRVEATSHRFVHMATHSTTMAAYTGPQDALAKVDVVADRVDELVFEAGQFPSEPVFVPRDGGVDEDDGYVLTLVYDGRRHLSFVGVYDAQRISEGALAKVWFDHHVPFTFHGIWHPSG